MNKDLLDVFQNVKDWLKYAEEKNAMLIAFNGVSIFGLIQLFELDVISNNSFSTYFLIVGIGLLVISLLLSFSSFVPELNIIRPNQESVLVQEANILYFDHLKDMSKEEIYRVVTGITKKKEMKKIDLDLAEQIQQISKIANQKYSLFTIAIWLTGTVFSVSILVGIITLLIQILCN